MCVPKVSIIILNWNGGEIVCKCIESVLKTDYPDFEVILVDNGSTDGSIEKVSKLFEKQPRLHILRLKKNTGFAMGNNIGALIAKGKYICFLNNDT